MGIVIVEGEAADLTFGGEFGTSHCTTCMRETAATLLCRQSTAALQPRAVSKMTSCGTNRRTCGERQTRDLCFTLNRHGRGQHCIKK